jgi:hypothetical protein
VLGRSKGLRFERVFSRFPGKNNPVKEIVGKLLLG